MNCATCFLAAAQVFFPAADTKPTAFDGASVRLENNTAVVDVAPRHKFCGVNFVFPKPVALNRYERLSTEISNRTDRALDFVVHGMAKGTHRRFVQGKVRLGPGERAVVGAPCYRRCYTMVTDGDGLPGMMGYDRKYRPDSVDHTGNISSVIVFCLPQETPAQFDVKRVWADGEQPDMTLRIDDAFFPFVDEFGQYMHADWPGKVHSLDELKARAKAEEEKLAVHPESPIPGVDRFGGWGAGPQLKATGMFRTEKWNGRWWLVDPDGHIFFSLGCCYVRLNGKTAVTAREKFFSWLPEKDDPLFGDCWHRGQHQWQNKCFYQGKGMVAQFDFAEANQKRIYGADWKAKFIDRQHRRMRAWGFTSMGNWSDPKVMEAGRTPYFDNFNLDGVRKIEGDKKGSWRKFPDVYAPDFEANVLKCAYRTRSAKSRTDPWCIGWFVENELHWATGNMGANGDVAKAVVDSPEDQPARIEYLRRLKAAHGVDATFKSATAEDVRAFEADIAERYFSTVKRVVQKVAPGRLYLGCRFCNSYPDAIRAAARHCDVVSYNSYSELPQTPRPETDIVDKPTIIGEFHFGSLDRGFLHSGLVPCRDMKERIEKYKAYVRAAIKDERLVGVHWFYWHDMPLTGWMDGENFGNGVMDVADNPHPEMVEATRELARELYRQ